jgi:hypothetical protein
VLEAAATEGRELAVSAASRWDAVELLRRLQALRIARTYMVQSAPERWLVYARPHRPAAVRELLTGIERWVADRGLDGVSVRLDGRDYRIERPA